MQSEQVSKQWGAVRLETGAVRFRLWASGQQQMTLRVEGHDYPMQTAGDGWFDITLNDLPAGANYQYVLADGTALPDPASRAQQGDVHGPSQVVDPHSYVWQYPEWQGRQWEETVVYELHIGTFTPQGTFRSAISKLPYLAELGITQIEVMPVSQTGATATGATMASCFTRRTARTVRRTISKPLSTPLTGWVYPWCWILCSTILALKATTCRDYPRTFSTRIA